MVGSGTEMTLMLPTEAEGVRARKHSLLAACQALPCTRASSICLGLGIRKVAFSLET